MSRKEYYVEGKETIIMASGHPHKDSYNIIKYYRD